MYKLPSSTRKTKSVSTVTSNLCQHSSEREINRWPRVTQSLCQPHASRVQSCTKEVTVSKLENGLQAWERVWGS